MRVLVVNAGSSSLKLRVVGACEDVLWRRDLPALTGDDLAAALHEALDDAPAPGACGHRIVHGGDRFGAPVVLDDATLDALDGVSSLAPLHNGPALAAARALRAVRPGLAAVACFDTAFHASLGEAARTYALPRAWADRWALPRYGFHGLSHAWSARRVPEMLDRPAEGLRLVSCHLGAGASLAAIADGRSVDTTMGTTPLDGLVMATRSGSVDPGLLLWVLREGGLSASEAEHALMHEAGLLGLSGRSGDMREILAGREAGDEACRLAIAVYVHRLAAGVAAMAAALGGLDAVSFTGGVGEGASAVRAEAVGRLGFLGAEIDGDRNDAAIAGADAVVSPPGARVPVLVVGAREDLEIARGVHVALGRP